MAWRSPPERSRLTAVLDPQPGEADEPDHMALPFTTVTVDDVEISAGGPRSAGRQR